MVKPEEVKTCRNCGHLIYEWRDGVYCQGEKVGGKDYLHLLKSPSDRQDCKAVTKAEPEED